MALKFISLLCAVTHAFAAPIQNPLGRGLEQGMNMRRDGLLTLSPRVIHNPHITSPKVNDRWKVGQTATVTWFVHFP